MPSVFTNSNMESFFIYIGIGLLLLMFIPLYRVVQGPTVISRILGVNVIGTKTTILVIIIGTIYTKVEMFVDIAITYALLNFITSLAAARFFQKNKQMCPDTQEESKGEDAC
ncbi:MAG: monovalent cation/H+ antiporter complex subunit F [Desulfobulbaceae bacterium]|jgi:multicomponent Na+:H+ antiporter subunit F|nr:monovalent cation/H+ antiporter complex subunit F [Desulfobulbaceae bacterium]